MDVLVIGAGVVGLTTAISLAEAGLSVTIRTAELPGQTTSVAAGAVWGAVKVGPPERAAEWGRAGLEVLSKLAAEPGTGVRMAAGREVSRTPFEPYYWMRMLPDLRACGPSELPEGFTDGWRYTAPLVTMPVHLEYLRARFERAGGTLEVSPVTSLAGLAGAAPVIVNCSGAAAHDLVPDPAVVPVRGQVVIAANPGIDEFLVSRDPEPPWIVYMFPHGDTILLGGTNDEGNWDTEPSPEVAERIMAGCVAIEPRLRGAEILGHRVGLRPCRPEVRLESEPLGDGVLWHNYGHGGAGISMSWGCAAEITRAVQSLRGAGVRALAALAAVGVAVAGVVALAACGTPVSAATTAAWRPVAGARIACHSAVQRDDLDAAVLDVAADGPADAWAVGVCGADGGTHDFIGQVPTGFVEHWDGRRWSRVAVPASGEYDVVQAGSRQDVWVASLAGDPWAAGQSGSPAAMPGGANVIHWNGRSWAVAQRGLARSASVYALAAAAGNAWALGYLHGATTVLHWTGAAWRPVAGPAGFRFAATPQPPAADPVGGGFLAGDGARIWLGGENDATRPVIAQRAGGGWVTIRVPVTTTFGWIEAMAASGHGLWVRVGESDSVGGPAGRTVLERFDGRSWTMLSASPVPSPVNWSIAEINAGQGYGGYLLCGFRLSAAQRAAFYGFGWTCPAGLAVTALRPVPGSHVLWAAGAIRPGPAMRPAFARFG